MFLISVASKGLSVFVSGLESTLTGISISVDSKRLSLEIVDPPYYRDKCRPQEECYGDLPVD